MPAVLPGSPAPRVTLILLAHNEAATIADELRAFNENVIRHLPGGELLVAEDGSADGTRRVIESVAAEIPLRLTGGGARKGYARAVVDAVAAAAGSEFICICDGGAKHDPDDVWRLWALRDQFDVVAGRKTGRRDQWYRRALTAGLNLFLRVFFRVPVRDADSGLRLYNRTVVDRVIRGRLHFRGFISAEIAIRAIKAGLRYGEVSVSYAQREGPSRGLPLRSIPRAIWRLLADARALRRELGRP